MSSATHFRRLSRALAAGLTATFAGLIAAPLQTSAAPPGPAPSAVEIAPRPTAVTTNVQYWVNRYRQQHGLRPVALQSQLNKAAQTHANDMARRRYMSHIGSDGSNAGTRITRTGYKWWIWGENIAAGQTSSHSVVISWYNSPSHRAIMLDRRYVHMGVGLAYASDGTPYWCLLFASPLL